MDKPKFYQAVRELILAELASGALRPGDRLPSERALCARTGMNRNTVRHALLQLQKEGRIHRLDRRGWYVTPARLTHNPARHVNFARLAAAQGRAARWTTVDRGAPLLDGAHEACGPGLFPARTRVYEVENVFFLDGQKVAYVRNFLHAGRLEGIVPRIRDRAMTQVAAEDYGVALVQTDLLVRPEFLPVEVCAELDVPRGSPGLYIRRVKTDGAGQVVTVEHESWRFDAIELRVREE
ncbi:Putative transcriptional regulator of 2-aminoethylphosphonate degradation operons [Fundidesulfovibrio magnetotacticus]|uniref:Transcriptional regulator of 2-aminoethylphosphonate degradation operons n=1 Tax=Fundidesulfovibrio magnetotacticus TaxID=2730080 RepID=A0A6V8LMG4_9BACT|nr:GntR family transcriptional regulator [Fundidesulfovibrio magnetotacticus]GFK93863.1 Putative transcriptional regulator of 2-aminoethylphosphonate degradation operons [Fundidesulfovibrio magnetotacticus]